MTSRRRLVCAIMLDGTLRELHQPRRRTPDKQPVVRLPETAELLQALTANATLQRMRLGEVELKPGTLPRTICCAACMTRRYRRPLAARAAPAGARRTATPDGGL